MWHDAFFFDLFKAYPCEDLVAPPNAVVSCNGWQTDYARVCKIYCMEGYYLAVGFTDDTVFNCGATGTWFPMMSLQECVTYGKIITCNGVYKLISNVNMCL